MRYEQAHPGTLGRALAGDSSARRAYDAVTADAVAHAGGVAADGAVMERRRTSAAEPRLTTDSTTARALVAPATNLRNWQAHHLIPFESINTLPANVQHAIANSGWRLDSPENLIALPADANTYRAPPNSGRLPTHSGPHPTYNAEVSTRLQQLSQDAGRMAPAEIRAELNGIETVMRLRLQDQAGTFHPRVVQNETGVSTRAG